MRVFWLLLPALIPSWRFFQAVAASPRIERWDGERWVEAAPPPGRVSWAAMARGLFWNPSWNERLFWVTCAEKIAERQCPRAATILADRLGGAPFRVILFDGQTREEVYRTPRDRPG